MMERLPDWEGLLDTFFQENRLRSFEIGVWDCGLFSAGAIQAITGIDLAEPYRGTYSSPEDVSLEDIVSQTKLEECPPNYAHRGDLLLLRNSPNPPCLGILGLDGQGMMVTDNGLARIPRDRVLRSWHV
jgi:hypothetical protein